MRAEWQAHIDELLETYQKQQAKLQDLQEKMEAIGATGEAADGMVKVTVDRQGRMRELELDPRVSRKLGTAELAEAILAASDAAAASVAEQMRAAMEGLVPEGSDGPGFDFSKMLGKVPTNIDEVRERYGLLPK